MQCLTYVVFLSLAQCHGGKWPCHPCALPVGLCTSLASIPMTVVIGLGTRLCVRMCTKLENGVLSNGQQPQSVVNGFCSPGWIWSYEDTEGLWSCALWWASFFVLKSRWVPKPFLSYHWSEQRKKNKKMALLLPYSYVFVFRITFRQLYEPCWS